VNRLRDDWLQDHRLTFAVPEVTVANVTNEVPRHWLTWTSELARRTAFHKPNIQLRQTSLAWRVFRIHTLRIDAPTEDTVEMKL
jgi:hypothetical protein